MDNPVFQDKTWEDVKEKIKETHLEITDGDLDFISGGGNELLQRLADKLKKNKEQVKELIESIASNSGIAG